VIAASLRGCRNRPVGRGILVGLRVRSSKIHCGDSNSGLGEGCAFRLEGPAPNDSGDRLAKTQQREATSPKGPRSIDALESGLTKALICVPRLFERGERNQTWAHNMGLQHGWCVSIRGAPDIRRAVFESSFCESSGSTSSFTSPSIISLGLFFPCFLGYHLFPYFLLFDLTIQHFLVWYSGCFFATNFLGSVPTTIFSAQSAVDLLSPSPHTIRCDAHHYSQYFLSAPADGAFPKGTISLANSSHNTPFA